MTAIARPNAAPLAMTPLRPPSSVQALRNSLQMLRGGMYRDEMSPEDRSWISQRISHLEALLASEPNQQEAGKPLMILFASYPSQQLSETMAKARVAGYQVALGDLPPWAVQRAVEKWLRGEVDGKTAFCPAPPELRDVALEAMCDARRELGSWNTLMNAKPISEYVPPRPEPVAAIEHKPVVSKKFPAPKLKTMGPDGWPTSRMMSEQERALIEAFRNGYAPTNNDIASVEASYTKDMH